MTGYAMDGAWAVVAGEGFVLPVPYVGADLRLSWQIWGFSPSRGRIRTDFPAERPCEGLGGRNVQRGRRSYTIIVAPPSNLLCG